MSAPEIARLTRAHDEQCFALGTEIKALRDDLERTAADLASRTRERDEATAGLERTLIREEVLQARVAELEGALTEIRRTSVGSLTDISFKIRKIVRAALTETQPEESDASH